MKIKKTTLIATETDETLSVRLNLRAQPRSAQAWCEECAAKVPMLTPEEAAPLVGLSVRAIYRLVEDGLVHFQETSNQALIVCLNNLQGRNQISS